MWDQTKKLNGVRARIEPQKKRIIMHFLNLLGGSKCSLVPIYFVDAMMSAIGWKIPYSNGSNPGIM